MTEPATQQPQPADEPVEAATAAPGAAAASDPPPPSLARGILFAALAVPIGVVAWVGIWQAGFISAIVAFGVAWLALFLYRRGSRGEVTRAGFWVVVAITVVTLVLGFFGGVAWDMGTVLGFELPAAFADAEFWWLYRANLAENPELWSAYTPDILLSLLFGALGTFSVFRTLAKQTSGTPELRF